MKTKVYISVDQFKENFEQVPEAYFQDLDNRILNKTIYKSELKERMFLVLNSKPEGFELMNQEQNYFDSLIHSIESKTISVLKNQYWSIEKKKVEFQVPDQYFDQLSERINARIPSQKAKGNEIYWIPNLLNRPIYYAVAAILCLALGIGYLSTNLNDSTALAYELESLSKEEILHYVAANTDKIELNTIPNVNWEKEVSHHELSEKDVNDLILTDEL